MTYYGHTRENPVTKEVLPKEEWQLLSEHLNEVARLARERAAKFGAGKLGEIIGLLHDVGKYSKEFQQRLQGSRLKVDHSTAGAQEVYRKFGNIGRALAYTIAGHHSGLPNASKGDPKNLLERLEKIDIPDYRHYQEEIQIPKLTNQDLAHMPKAQDAAMAAFGFAFCVRMLYSCLVDADYLDTERFMNFEKFKARPPKVLLTAIFQRLQNKLNALAEKNKQNPSPINTARQQILARCLAMAEAKPGLFTLTVPTGGGKTYSSLAFGLKHALTYNKDRLIYVIPYTSIIEQNAEVFRQALESDGEESIVLEHHSNFEYPASSFDEWNKNEKMQRLAAENWDMPVIATTAVQFFESLFANKGARCRKLHNIVNSVIILDEAQMMPIEYLKPCLWALAELVLNYGATVVLCTATQPAVKDLIPGKLNVVEIMEDPVALQAKFKRVKVDYAGTMTDDNLAAAMADAAQVLAIVNTRRHARLLFDKLSEITADGVYHLSARMCPAHRKEILDRIRQALNQTRPCRVVSTQLIEAGVDLDFPLVYRAAAGLDSIAQAAGRCNREGRLERGQVIVFDPESHGMPSRGRFTLVAGITRSIARQLPKYGGDLLSLAAIEDYFKQLFSLEQNCLDAEGILPLIKAGGKEMAFPFADIADKFKFIDNDTVPVIVPWDERAVELMDEAEHHPYPASKARQLQPYVVQVYYYELRALEKAGVMKTVDTAFKFLTDRSFYDDRFGLKDAHEVKAPTEVLMF